MYDVSTMFLEAAARKNATWRRKLYIGSSNYSQYVMKWPRIKRQWDKVNPSTVTIELSNDNQALNFFMNDKTKLHTSCSLQMAVANIANNQLPYSDVFSPSANWANTGAIIVTAASSGFTTLQDSNSSGGGQLAMINTFSGYVAGTIATLSLQVRQDSVPAATRRPGLWLGFCVNSDYSTGARGYVGLYLNTQNGSHEINASTSAYSLGYSITSYDGAWKVKMSAVCTAADATHAIVWIGPAYSPNAAAVGSTDVRNVQVAFDYMGDVFVASSGTRITATEEAITLFTGTVDAVRYNEGTAHVTLIDKFRKLEDRTIGTSTSAKTYTGSSYLVHDLAWYVCTSHGGLSATANSSNPDINYQSFTSWTSVFSADNIRIKAEFEGDTALEALQKIAALTHSAIWIENDKIKFMRFTVSDSARTQLLADTVIDVEHTLDDRDLLNKCYVSAAYSSGNDYWGINVFDQSSDSQSRYGLREEYVDEDHVVWLVDSVSALGLAQRKVIAYKEIKGRFTAKTPLHSLASAIGDCVYLVDSHLLVADTYRQMEESIDMDTGAKELVLDQTQFFSAFTLDVSALDSSDVLV